MRRAAWVSGTILWVCGRAIGGEVPCAQSQLGFQPAGPESANPKCVPDHSIGSEYIAQAAIDSSIFEVHQVVVTLPAEDKPARLETERHVREREQLLQRMSRKHGKWNEHHPRYRLLEALRGFSHYAQTQRTELDRLRGLYNHVSKKQKAVSSLDSTSWSGIGSLANSTRL
jgi:hypothetical protein